MRLIEKSVHTAAYQRLLTRLREARQKAGLSQEQVAARLITASGLSSKEADHQRSQTQRLVSRWETGETRLDVFQLWTLCQALELPFVEFLSELDRDFQR